MLVSLSPVSREAEDEDLNIQCDTFEDSLTEDQEEMERLYGGIDMSSHQQVFTSLFTKVRSTCNTYICNTYICNTCICIASTCICIAST